jgi:O-antigen/teichoic acid export membrane protein
LNPLKRLAGQTAIYGSTTIIGRLLNYLLVPLHVRIFAPEQYGVVGEMYAYVSLLIVILTYGMETAFFRFTEQETDKKKVFSGALASLLTTSSVFILLTIIFAQPLANIILHPDHKEYIIWFSIVIAFDALTTIPFARLRAQNKAKRFALIKMVNIFTNIGFNVFFLVICPLFIQHHILTGFISAFYDKSVGVGYIFIANLLASIVTLILLLPEMIDINLRIDLKLLKKMLWYAFPLLIFGLAGIVNETMDRIFLKYLSPQDIAMKQVGIYSACYKISIMMTIFIQAFKYAAEPFFFSQAKESNAKHMYAQVMKYFVIACSLIFLVIMLYMDIVKHFVDRDYYEGLKVVPILLLANMFIGMFYNLSIWYKLTNQTRFGAYISLFGAILTLILNYLLIPLIGYMGSAWATFICYFSMMVVSFIIGQKYYRVEYNLKAICGYMVLAVGLFLLHKFLNLPTFAWRVSVGTVFMLIYVLVLFGFEKKNFQKLIK